MLNKLKTINQPSLKPYSHGTDKTIADFYDNFIEPRLPSAQTVIDLHRALVNYVRSKDPVFVLRIFNEKSEDKIRRGFYTSLSINSSFFYTDNSFAYFFAKMALDGFCPKDFSQELLNLMHSRQFPYKYTIGGSLQNEKKYAAFPAWTTNPGISAKSYKLAHVYSVGGGSDCEYYDKNTGTCYSISNVVNAIFPRGAHADWQHNGTFWERKLTINDQAFAKEFLIASFLRFVDPMNYFLAPKAPYKGVVYNSYTTHCGQTKSDIAEYMPLLAYVGKQFNNRYGNDYDDFLNRIMLPPQRSYANQINQPINIKYDPNGLGNRSTSRQAPPATRIGTVSRSGFTDRQKMEVALHFLKDGFSLKKLETIVLNTPTDRHGSSAKNILDSLSIENKKKGILNSKTIDEEIDEATGEYKETLQRLKIFAQSINIVL